MLGLTDDDVRAGAVLDCAAGAGAFAAGASMTDLESSPIGFERAGGFTVRWG